MATIVQNTDLVGAGLQISETVSTILIVTKDTVIANTTSGSTISLGGTGGHIVDILGEVYGGSNVITTSGDNNFVTIGSTGKVSNSAPVGSNIGAVHIPGDNATLVNHGYVKGGSALVVASGDSGRIENAGTAIGTNALVLDTMDANAHIDIFNSGYAFGSSLGFKAFSGLASHTHIITNTGILGGNVASIQGTVGVEKVYNSGELIGDVELGGGNDLYDGRGRSVVGLVRGGDGDDIFVIDDASLLLVEAGGEGSDLVKSSVSFSLNDNFENLTLIGSADITGEGNSAVNNMAGNSGRNTLSGRGGADTISGFGGADLILGGASGDTLNGDDGDDVLRGGKGNDTINGGNEDDLLRGGSGSDDLKGGNGEDRLIGGADSDTLNGGAGADMFVFRRATDSKGVDSDHIVDFEVGLDQIILSGLNSGLTFIGSAGFSGTAPEVRVGVSGADSVVRIDLDGDGTTDMRIDIDGVTGLSGIDFLL